MNVSREDVEKNKVNKIDSNSVYHGKRKALEDQEINLQIILERQDRLATIIEEYTQLGNENTYNNLICFLIV